MTIFTSNCSVGGKLTDYRFIRIAAIKENNVITFLNEFFTSFSFNVSFKVIHLATDRFADSVSINKLRPFKPNLLFMDFCYKRIAVGPLVGVNL